MNNLPAYVSFVFVLTTFLTVFLFYRTTNNSKPALIILVSWLILQAVLGFSRFYTVTDSMPPRFLLLVAPPLLLIIGLFVSSKGRAFLDGLDIRGLTILHTIRIPVELVLFWLFMYNVVPQLMTFEGRNFDILSGLTAPLIFYFSFINQKLNKKVVVLWNFICMGLLINIVTQAALSAPSPFQKFAFDQPNIAIFHFPYNWLPSCIVPIVLLSHLATIRQLLKN